MLPHARGPNGLVCSTRNWADVLTSHVRAFLKAAETRPAHEAVATLDDLLQLPSRLLDGRSNGAACRAIARMQRAQQGLSLWEE
jgi:hypothetical protein